MFNFLKKEELLGVYVNFSKATAKSNPDMISREYLRLIEDIEKEIEQVKINIKNTFIPIIISAKEIGDIRTTLENTSYSNYFNYQLNPKKYLFYDEKKERNVTAFISQKSKTRKKILNISPKVLDEHLKKILEYEKNIKRFEEKLYNIQKEHRWFLIIFKKNTDGF